MCLNCDEHESHWWVLRNSIDDYNLKEAEEKKEVSKHVSNEKVTPEIALLETPLLTNSLLEEVEKIEEWEMADIPYSIIKNLLKMGHYKP